MSNSAQDTAKYPSEKKLGSGFFVPISPSPHVEFGTLSDVGCVRERNEDHFAVFRRTRSQEPLATSLPEGILPISGDETFCFVVADGMGGAAAGELASRVAIQKAWHLTEQASSWVMRLRDLAAQQVQERIEGFLSEMHRTLRQMGEADPELTGMGTTWTSVYVVGWHALVAHIGDSRAYHWRQGTLRQVTRDQTLAQVLIDSGVPPEDTRKVRHLLTNTLGGERDVILPDVGHVVLQDKDRLLLCTDGLTDQISDSELTEHLALPSSPQAACDALIQLALERGGKDNVTVILAEFAVEQPARLG
jgi:protein phosphatase